MRSRPSPFANLFERDVECQARIEAAQRPLLDRPEHLSEELAPSAPGRERLDRARTRAASSTESLRGFA